MHNFDRDLGAWEINCTYKKLEKAMNQATYIEGNLNEQYISKLKQSNNRLLSLVKSSMDIVVAIGLVHLAPNKVTPRVTEGFGFISSAISCYQLLPPSSKAKAQ